MAADEVLLLNLFDFYWFEHAILSTKSHVATNPVPLQLDQEEPYPSGSGLPTLIVRSMSDQCFDTKSTLFSSNSSFSSPHSVLTAASKLQTIVSGKQVTDFSRESLVEKEPGILEVGSAPLKKRVLRKRRNRLESSKSLSDLEFQELKGFIDLGFVFTEEDNKDSKLVSIIPGLQRLVLMSSTEDEEDRVVEDKKSNNNIDGNGSHDDHVVISRPYLSEAWDALEYQRKEDRLMNWRVPAANLDKDMKHHLKSWAHTVASTVR